MTIRKLLLSLILAFLGTGLAAAAGQLDYTVINNNTGLSNSSVTAIFQDSDDLMWFGTWNGLNVYDGASIRQYRPYSSDPSSISHQVIRSVAEDSTGRIWVATDFGINRLDKKKGSFTKYFLGYSQNHIYEEGLFSCCISPEGMIVAALRGGGVSVFDYDSDTFSQITDSRHIASVLFFDASSRLWTLTEEGQLAVLVLAGDKIRQSLIVSLPDTHGRPVFDGVDRVWIQSGADILYIDIYSGDFDLKSSGHSFKSSLNTVRNIDGHIYLGTTTGCYEIALGGGRYERHTEENISVLSIFKGTQKILWLGTDGKGVYKENYRPAFISAFSTPANGKFPVRAIYVDDYQNIYIGSKGGGLSVGKASGGFRNYNVGAGKTYNSVLSLAATGDLVWVGTDGPGLKYVDARTGAIHDLNLKNHESARNISSVYDIEPVGKDSLYLGTSGNGLFLIVTDGAKAFPKVLEVKNFRHSTEGSIGSNIIYDIADCGEYLWIATRGGGLNRFSKKTETVQMPEIEGPVWGNDILSLLYDSRDRLWVGTSSGLWLIEPTDEGKYRSQYVDESAGMPGTSIHSILEGCDGSTWASTDKGIAKISLDAASVMSWTYQDGLSDNEFSDGAGFSFGAGRKLWFGSVAGVDVISPAMVEETSYMPELSLNSVKIDNEDVSIEDGEIRAGYRSGSVSLRFSLPDYVSGTKSAISYFLTKGELSPEELSVTRWVNMGESKTIILNRLSPGRYTLYVRAVNARQEAGEPQKYMITVSWPRLLHPWMICLYLCILIVVAIVFYLMHSSRKAALAALEKEKRDNAIKEEIVQAKFRFFTNIAHEFSNSITLIFGAVEQIFTTGEDNARERKQLMAIRSNADRMHRQIQELMEFSKADSGHLPVLYEKVDVNELVRYTYENFIDLVESKKIAVSIDTDESLPVWISDRSALEKIVFNLISNSMKYTPSEGWIEVRITGSKEAGLEISIKNNGPGIPPEKLTDIFDRYVILDNFESKLSTGRYTRTGIGLALTKDLTELLGGRISVDSKVNEYTVFTVSLPWTDEALVSPAPTTLPAETPSAQPKKQYSGKRPKVLIVDDFADLRNLIADILSDNFDTVQAQDAETALKLMEDFTPSLIISDIVMPGMGGTDFVKRIKSSEKTGSIPVVMLSCHSDMENRADVIETGADVFIVKPFHPRYLRAVVERMLEKPATTLEKTMKKVDSQVKAQDENFSSKVMDALSKNFSDENYNQDALAYDLAMSRVQLYRKIKHELDTTPGELIRRYRIRQAELMLVETDKTVQEIMFDCGFHNKAYFYREFSRIHDCSPLDFRSRRGGDVG